MVEAFWKSKVACFGMLRLALRENTLDFSSSTAVTLVWLIRSDHGLRLGKGIASVDWNNRDLEILPAWGCAPSLYFLEA